MLVSAADMSLVLFTLAPWSGRVDARSRRGLAHVARCALARKLARHDEDDSDDERRGEVHAASGNALALIITGTGHRTTRAYDGKPAAAPLLHLEYTTG